MAIWDWISRSLALNAPSPPALKNYCAAVSLISGSQKCHSMPWKEITAIERELAQITQYRIAAANAENLRVRLWPLDLRGIPRLGLLSIN
jgi:hypothetical protein